MCRRGGATASRRGAGLIASSRLVHEMISFIRIDLTSNQTTSYKVLLKQTGLLVYSELPSNIKMSQMCMNVVYFVDTDRNALFSAKKDAKCVTKFTTCACDL